MGEAKGSQYAIESDNYINIVIWAWGTRKLGDPKWVMFSRLLNMRYNQIKLDGPGGQKQPHNG